MKNLIKNVVRSFKRNKISIIGLVFLLFFGLGAFCIMSNTTHNIKSEYTSLAKQGKLHDFTAAELYEVGDASYVAKTKGITYTIPATGEPTFAKWTDETSVVTHDIYNGLTFPTGVGTYQFSIPQQQIVPIDPTDPLTDYNVIRTYDVSLDPNTSTGLYKFFAESSATDPKYINFQIRTVHYYESGIYIPDEVQEFSTLLNNWDSLTDADLQRLCEINIFVSDNDVFLAQLNDQTQIIYNIMTTTNTKLALYLDEHYANEVEHRFFKSLNVTGTKDNIFYKIIDSNPTDTIDKMVLFADKANRTGNYLFNSNDWAPYNSQIEFYDQTGALLDPGSPVITGTTDLLFVPSNFNDVALNTLYTRDRLNSWTPAARYVYSQIMQIRFKRMLSGDSTIADVKPTLKTLAATELDRDEYNTQFYESSDINTAYANYLYYWHDAYIESITISANGNVVFSWEVGTTPQTCTISNWTSRFAIVNPQHLEKNNKRVLNPSQLNSFAPFKEWYKAVYGNYPTGELDQKRSAAWFNSLNSEQFGFWLDPNTKDVWTTMSYDIPGWEQPLVVARGRETGQWNGVSEQHISSCGGFNEIIWGCGLTPDFMYPVVDISRPTPNTKTECLVYCNEAGYNSIKLAFITSTVEEYLLARFKPNVNTNRRHAIVDEINDWAKENMIFPSDVKCAYFADDTSNVLNCSGFRVAYLPHLVSVVETVTAVLCTFIGILCLIICFVIIKRYVEGNRVNIGIMRANGIKKWKIGLSLLPFALFPAIIGGVAAYFLGLFLQPAALALFSSYWMLPTPLLKFDWVSFLSCIFVPFIVFSIICFVTTMVVLRVRTVDLMKPGSEFKTNAFSRVVKKPFKHFGVMTRFRVSLAFNSITRLLMLAAMSCLTMSSLVFAFTTFDKLNKSRETNSSQFKYSFNLELTTPTSGGSTYNIYDYYNDGQTRGFGASDPEQYIFNTSWNTTEAGHTWTTQEGVNSYKNLTKWYSDDVLSFAPFTDIITGDEWYKDVVNSNGTLFLPTISDSDGQKIDPLFLQNKMCSKLTLDHIIGVPGLASSNPWEIALALMPSNSRNVAADSFNNIINVVGHKLKDQTNKWLDQCIVEGVTESYVNYDTGHVTYDPSYENAVYRAAATVGNWISVYGGLLDGYWGNNLNGFVSHDETTDTYSLVNDITVIGELFMGFNRDFIQFIKNIYTDPNLMKLEYPITYGTIPLNWGVNENDDVKPDETYTYINGDMYRRGKDYQIKIEGIKKNSAYINLTDKKGHSLNDRLFDENYLQSLNIDEDTHPIIVNAYAAHKYHFKVGQTITVNVTNTVDRFEQQIHPELYKAEDNEAHFKIVGVSQGTNNEAYYTRQDAANNILGLPNGQSWNKTHKYMMWSSSSSDVPQLVDLAGLQSQDDEKVTLYSFQNSEPTVVDGPQKLTGVAIPEGFNGIYTQNKDGKPLTAGLSLYSYTGLYPGASVFKSSGQNNKFEEILGQGPNLAIANLMSGINNPTYYQACSDWLGGSLSPEAYKPFLQSFISDISYYYGDTTMITAIAGAIDVAASDLVYSNLIATFDLAETSIMAIIIPITIIIVAVISNLIINDSKKMAAMMKALGYSDSKNLMSILALFIPTIVVGLALAVPLSLGLTLGYQSIIFNTANILVDVTQKWWFYVAAVGGIGVILIGTYGIGFVSLKRDRLVDRIK